MLRRNPPTIRGWVVSKQKSCETEEDSEGKEETSDYDYRIWTVGRNRTVSARRRSQRIRPIYLDSDVRFISMAAFSLFSLERYTYLGVCGKTFSTASTKTFRRRCANRLFDSAVGSRVFSANE